MVGVFLRRLLGGWRLERKFLLFSGGALLISLCLSFWAVQIVAETLVMETTRQAARDFAQYKFLLDHYEDAIVAPKVVGDPIIAKKVAVLRDTMLYSNYSYEVLRLDAGNDFDFLKGALPETGSPEEKILATLKQKVEATWTIDDDTPTSNSTTSDATEDDQSTMGARFSRRAPNQKDLVFAETISSNGFYYYYHPVAFDQSCFDCHGELKKDPDYPFRVQRVGMLYKDTRLWTIWSFSILIAIAIATLGITLFIFHSVLKSLVIRPLNHLHQVSDEISRGLIDRKAEIDTEDEFHELAEAFNRMLRHWSETEGALRNVNVVLDTRVDELAQANLQLYEANRLKSDFLANMSHELRTPLNSILGFSEVLQGFDSLTDKQKRYASNIQKSGRLLLDMINDILDLAKVEAGKMEVRPTHFDALEVVKGQCEIVRHLSEEKNIDLQVDTQLDSLPVYQDQTKLQQILTNLLSNAIKFTPEGGLITVEIGRTDAEKFYLAVIDTGVGIAEDDFEIIFEKFRQSRSTVGTDGLTREYSGTGLGLSIVREMCKLLGGEVMLSSQLGQGSTFRVELPEHFAAGFSTGNAPQEPSPFSG